MAIWRDYKSEVIFGLVLLAAVLVSYGLAHLIPLSFYIHALSPILNGCIAMTSIFGAFLLIRHHEGVRVRILWAGILLVWAALCTMLLLHVMAYIEPLETSETFTLRGRELLIGNVYAWLLLLYPTAVLRPGWLNVKRALATLLPIIGFALLDYALPFDIRWLLAIYPVFLGVMLMFYHVRAYRLWCEENFSSMEHIDVRWIWRYMIMFFITGVAYTVMSFEYNAAHAFTQQWLLLLMLAYSTEQILYRQDPWNIFDRARAAKAERAAISVHAASWSDKLEVIEEEPENTLTFADEKDIETYKEQLEAWMAKEQPYLNPEFRLLDLREVLPLNRTYLSQFISTAYGCNFYQFVARYRVDEAQRLMRENPGMKMQEIAEQCGFSSQATFAHVFARETDMSPTEWQKKFVNS